MGADLIGYHLVGPTRISASKQKQAAAQLRRWRSSRVAAIKRGLTLPPSQLSEQELSILKEINENLSLEGFLEVEYVEPCTEDAEEEVEARLQEVLQDCGLESEDTDAQVDEFVDFWNSPSARDTSEREVTYKSKTPFKVVFAGDMSWGDEPEGHGYQILKRACLTGVALAVGCV